MKDKNAFQRILLVLLILFNITSYAAGTRTFTFVNNCSQPVWFGLSGGSAQSKLTGSLCNSNSDCNPGSSCVQTGNIKQCFWVNPQPANGNYQLAAKGGTNQITIPITDNADIIWSGVIAGRTACTADGCQTADCGNGPGSCLPSRGFSQPATQAEFTLSAKNVDFYDVEVINGVNLPIQMTPSVPAIATAPYTCGSPGATKASSPLLGACTWQLTPPSNDYRWVKNGGNACSVDSDCQGASVCGLSFNPGQNPLLKKSCGPLLGYWTANQVCGIQRDYGAPFNCAQPLAAPQNNLTMWNLQACVDIGSCYQPDANATCCGCANWNQMGISVPAAPYTEQCRSQNPTWVSAVQPTLQWLKKACPTVYTYPFDDMSSTFTCANMQNNVNTVNYTITYCPEVSTPTPPPVTQKYSYNLTLGYPFAQVLINNSFSCPSSVGGNSTCLVKDLPVGSTLTIKGGNGHLCSRLVNAKGNLDVNGNENYCYINVGVATATSPGAIALPAGF